MSHSPIECLFGSTVAGASACYWYTHTLSVFGSTVAGASACYWYTHPLSVCLEAQLLVPVLVIGTLTHCVSVWKQSCWCQCLLLVHSPIECLFGSTVAGARACYWYVAALQSRLSHVVQLGYHLLLNLGHTNRQFTHN